MRRPQVPLAPCFGARHARGAMKSVSLFGWSVVATLGLACGPTIDPSGDGETGSGSSSSDGDTDTGADTPPMSDPDDDCAAVLGIDPEGAASPSVRDGWAYWSTLTGGIARSPLDAAAPEILLTTDDNYVDVTVAGGRLLYTAADRVAEFDVATGQTVVLATGQNNPIRPFAIGSRIYWINAGSGILASDLMRLDPGADEPTLVLDFFGFPMGAAADESSYYLAAKDYSLDGELLDGAVLRIDDATGAATLLASPVFQPSGLALTADRVVWVEQTGPNFSRPGYVRSVDKMGGVTAEHAQIEEGLGVTVAADARDLFFSVFDTDVTRVHRIDWASGAEDVFADFPGSTVVDMALTDDAVVLTTSWSEGTVAAGTPSVTRLCRD